jgi:hypothetical protein
MFKRKPGKVYKGFKKKTIEEVREIQKKRRKVRRVGGSSLKQDKIRWNNEWKEEHKHITWCESCGNPDGPGDAKLTQMHALKQRMIVTEEDCKRAAKVCWGEHRPKDEATGPDTHLRMAEFVDNLIAIRQQV